MRVNPCKDCTERKVGCHGSCDKYTQWRAERDEAILGLYKERTHEFDLREKAQREHTRRKWEKRGYKSYK